MTHVSDVEIRGRTHGSYDENAKTAQMLKSVLRSSLGWSNLTSAQKETLDLTCTKIARILAGDPDFADHWNDIEGYARLAKDRCSK